MCAAPQVIDYRMVGWSLIIDGDCFDLSLLPYIKNDL
jgi:hypothetical protein